MESCITCFFFKYTRWDKPVVSEGVPGSFFVPEIQLSLIGKPAKDTGDLGGGLQRKHLSKQQLSTVWPGMIFQFLHGE